MIRHLRLFICIIGLTGLCSCDDVSVFDFNISLKHPVQQLTEKAAKQEPSLDQILEDWGYTKEQIANPLMAQSFYPIGDVRLTWIAKHTDKHMQIIWVQNDETYPLLLTDNIMHIPTILQTKDEPLGLSIKVLDENPYSIDLNANQNNSKSHVKVFHAMQNHSEQKSSFLLCWDIDEYEDFNDIIIRLEGVEVILVK